jgi:hypothetical protein
VIKEALRLHPPICFPLERVVPPEGVTLCGHYVPGGTIVGVMAPVMNHNKDVYGADALTFRPERWTEASPEKLKVMERSYTAVCLSPLEVSPYFLTFLNFNSLVKGPVRVSGRILPCSRSPSLCHRYCGILTWSGHPSHLNGQRLRIGSANRRIW